MHFGATIAGDVFQCKLDECFGKTEPVMIIVDDIMIVGHKQDHSNYDQAFTNLLQVAKSVISSSAVTSSSINKMK